MAMLPVSAKKRPSQYIAINRNMHYSLQNTSRNAYRYISLYIAMVVFFADTGMASGPGAASPSRNPGGCPHVKGVFRATEQGMVSYL